MKDGDDGIRPGSASRRLPSFHYHCWPLACLEASTSVSGFGYDGACDQRINRIERQFIDVLPVSIRVAGARFSAETRGFVESHGAKSNTKAQCYDVGRASIRHAQPVEGWSDSMTDRFRDPTPDSDLSARTDTSPLNAREAAAHLGLNERTIRRAIARGDLAATMHAGNYRIALADLLNYHNAANRERRNLAPPNLVALPAFKHDAGPALPRPLTALIGRETEAADLREIIARDDTSLVTLVGPGGVGKTRLAMEVAATTGAFPDGACVVRLAPIRQPDLVTGEIARALGLPGHASRPLADRLAPALHNKRFLLLLDNFEHVLDAAPHVSGLMTAFPQLTVLVTSRSPLRISGERLYSVPSLALDPASAGPARDLASPAAVRLFVERAQAVREDFALTAENAHAVAGICRGLDGLPLAIELAAAHLRSVQPAELLARMDRSLPLLTGGGRDLPPRQQTMRNAIAWSYDLLGDRESALFRRLSAFVGGISLPAALAAAADLAGNDVESLDLIEALIDTSLIRRVTNDGRGTRYLMLETIREYGQELLASHGETRFARDAHAAYFLRLGAWLDPNVLGPGERFDDRLIGIEAELPNLTAALTHLDATGDSSAMLELAGRCAVIWHHRGYLVEGRRWLEHAIEAAPSAPTAAFARAHAGLSLIQWSRGVFPEARDLAILALDSATACRDVELEALSLHMMSLSVVGEGDYQAGREYMLRALALWRELGQSSNEGMAHMVLSSIEYQLGNVTPARRYAVESIELFRRLGHASGSAFGAARLAWFAAADGEIEQARGFYIQALRQWSAIGERWAINAALLGLADIALQRQQPDIAALLLGAVEVRVEAGELVRIVGGNHFHAEVVERVRLAFLPERFDELRAEGRELGPEEMVLLASGIAAISPSGQAASGRLFDLTPREREVLLHIVEGRSNRQIAAALFVSERTVEHHVGHILAKLGVSSRTAAATHAIELGLRRQADPSG